MSTPVETADVAVIGGGIVGCAAARALARRGRRVVLFERGAIGGEQSGRAVGFVRTVGRDRREMAIAREASRMWNGLDAELGADLGFVRGGTLVLGETEADEAKIRRAGEAARERGLATRIIGPGDIRALVPALAGAWRIGLHTPDDGHGEPLRATLAFAEAARREGVRFETGEAVRDIVRANGQLAGVRTERGRLRARAVVCAAGVSSGRLLRPLGVRLPIQAVRSDVVETMPAAVPFQIGIWTPFASIRPRADGSLHLGSGHRGPRPDHDLGAESLRNLRVFLPLFAGHGGRPRVHVGRPLIRDAVRLLTGEGARWASEEPRVEDANVAARLAHVSSCFPSLGPLTAARAWSGRIDVTPDFMPAIGAIGCVPGLFVAAGFSSHGWALGPAVGEAVAELVATGRTRFDLAPFRIERFSDGRVAADPAAL